MAEILLILGLIILNGLFSMAEIALVSARKARLEGQANRGDVKAKAALKLANHPDKFLSTVQIGITLIGILTGIFSGEHITSQLKVWLQQFPTLQPYSNGIATTLVVIMITYLSLVIGELVPKRIGLSNPEAIAKWVAGPMRIISGIAYPFVWLLTKSSGLIVRIFGLKPNDNQVTEEEIKAIISEGTEHGAIEEAEQEIIERVFHLGDRNITSLMTHRSDIVWIDVNDTAQKIKKELGEVIHSFYPVCDDEIDNIKGIISVKELLVADDDATISKLMKPAMYVPENNTAYQVLEKFKATKVHHCFIVDEYGSVQGLITLNDILEAIVGDIPQPDEEEYEIVERHDGSFLADAQMPFYDFLSKFNKVEWMNEGEHNFDTLAGFMLHELQRIPHTGETMEWKGFTFEVIDMDAQRIDKILITVEDDIKEDMEG
jgi:putative hemolysin